MSISTISNPILIGFAGGSGAGKTTLVSSVQKRLGDHRAAIFSLDWYYKDINFQKNNKLFGTKNSNRLKRQKMKRARNFRQLGFSEKNTGGEAEPQAGQGAREADPEVIH